METKMNEEVRKEFLVFQKRELNAVVSYQKMQGLTDDEKLKAAFREASADEGRHAAILKGYTGETLAPDEDAGEALLKVAAEQGLIALVELMSKREYAAPAMYAPYADDYPELKQVMADEVKHGDSMAAQAARLRDR